FFQAEDGIRDFHVTGVQTCALPICVAVTRGHDHRLVYTNQAYRSLFGDLPLGVPIRQEFAGPTGKDPFRLFDQVMKSGEPVLVRSEERRVGKEGRCRWAATREESIV